MPLLRLETTMALPEEERKPLVASLSKLVAETLGKPETYVMVTFHSTAIRMSGTAGDAAFADIRSIGGLTGDVNRRLSEKICETLRKALGIPPERVYLNFTDVPATHWGWKGSTFG